MCVVRRWACEVRCAHDDWHVEVGLFPFRVLEVKFIASDEQPQFGCRTGW